MCLGTNAGGLRAAEGDGSRASLAMPLERMREGSFRNRRLLGGRIVVGEGGAEVDAFRLDGVGSGVGSPVSNPEKGLGEMGPAPGAATDWTCRGGVVKISLKGLKMREILLLLLSCGIFNGHSLTFNFNGWVNRSVEVSSAIGVGQTARPV